MEQFYLTEILSIELELNNREKELLNSLLELNFGNSAPGENDPDSFKKDFTGLFGNVKYEAFRRWYDSKGIIYSRPEKKWLVNDYNHEIAFTDHMKELIKKITKKKLTSGAPYLAYKNAAEKKLFPLFANKKNSGSKYTKTLAVLCRCRVNSSKIENQIFYIADAPQSLKNRYQQEFRLFFAEKKSAYKKNHDRTKSKLKNILTPEQQILFSRLFGWDLHSFQR
ncbi:MAG: hypothetical protein ACLFP1_00700 [Candidatus Goldiibacteriota bacterium]